MSYRPPFVFYAVVLAIVSGALLATGRYLGGAITGIAAFVLITARYIANERGEDDNFTLW